jgi:hypothetical protein
MEAIPTYPMMTVMIPSSVLKEAQRLQQSFIWVTQTQDDGIMQ